jgi:hypothetical protein
MAPADGQTRACASTPATTSDSVKHSTRVASTVATTELVSAATDPRTSDERDGPWVNAVA